jgi:hypothetical protein
MTGQYENQAYGFAYINNKITGEDTKLEEDRYEIYLNSDFIGYKTLLNASEHLSDVDDFLKSQGINDFETQLDGDHYMVSANNDEKIRDVLTTYCQNR